MTKNKYHIALARIAQKIDFYLGLQFPAERWNILLKNLEAAAPAFNFLDIDSFIEWLQVSRLDKKQIELLSTFLTITETFFWRESFVFDALTNLIIPDFISSTKNKTIRIWSAGCSSGEEPYSLAIALHRSIPDIKNWNISIFASDVNNNALQKAKKGIYSRWSFRNCPPWFRKTYFTQRNGENYEIIPEIKNMVHFSNLNLTDNNYQFPGERIHHFDFIFCRNVLMYFSKDWVEKITNTFHHLLKKEGWLVVASCELSTQSFKQFTPVNFHNAILYRKSTFESGYKTSTSLNINDSPALHPKNINKKSEKVLTNQGKDIFRISISNNPLNGEKSDEQISIKRETTTSEEIRVLAGSGKLEEAFSACNEDLKKDKLNKGLYLLKASIQQEMKQYNSAISSLEQAIYIDPDFIMAHFFLGNLLSHTNQIKEAKRHFANVMNQLDKLLDTDIIPESEGMSVNHLKAITQNQMERINDYKII